MCVKLRTTENLVNALENSIDIPEGNHTILTDKDRKHYKEIISKL